MERVNLLIDPCPREKTLKQFARKSSFVKNRVLEKHVAQVTIDQKMKSRDSHVKWISVYPEYVNFDVSQYGTVCNIICRESRQHELYVLSVFSLLTRNHRAPLLEFTEYSHLFPPEVHGVYWNLLL